MNPQMSSGRLRQLGGAAVAVALVAAILAIARPATVWELLRTSTLSGLLPAAAVAGGALVMRGLRLVLLLPPGRIGVGAATLVAAAAQAAAWFVPARFGELALPLLLRQTTGWGLSHGVGTLLVSRTFDLAALGLWAGVAAVAVLGPGHPLAVAAAACLVIPPLLLPATLAVADRLAVRTLAPRGVGPRRWAHRVRRVRRAVDALRRWPLRLVGAATASVLMWALLWSLSWFLLEAMGFRWPAFHVVAGSAVASLANLLPFNLVGNFGTLEAGWTAAFVGLGIPTETAAATGLACHLWAAVFVAVYGALAWAILSIREPSRGHQGLDSSS